jgi:sporulation protein YlmC with PRC-barrel domain
MRLQLGRPVRCADNAVRELADVVLDSGGRRVTHLVVRPHQHPEAARLVPVGLAEADESNGQISLDCTEDVLDELEAVHASAYLLPGQQPETDEDWDIGVEDMYPSYDQDPSDFGEGLGSDRGVGVFYDRVPRGEIELRQASSVYSADGHHVGQVEGLVLDDELDSVTHLLLARGHFWWRREIAVPNDAVSRFETDLVTLSVPKSGLKGFSSRRLR